MKRDLLIPHLTGAPPHVEEPPRPSKFAMESAELLAEAGLEEISRLERCHDDDCLVVGAAVDPAEWPAWTDEVAFGVTDQGDEEVAR